MYNLRLLRHLPKVRGPAQRLPARFCVQYILRLCDAQVHRRARLVRDAPRLVGVVEDEGWVDGPGAGGSWEAAERGEAHGGVEGAAVLDAADGGTGAKVHEDEVEGGCGLGRGR